MSLRILTADDRLSASNNKTSLAIFGPPGVGKTSLLRTLPADKSLCLDLEAGLKSVQEWRGASMPIRSYADFQDVVAMLAGPDPAAEPSKWYSVQHCEHIQRTYAGTGIPEFLNSKPIIFVDSITDLTRQA